MKQQRAVFRRWRWLLALLVGSVWAGLMFGPGRLALAAPLARTRTPKPAAGANPAGGGSAYDVLAAVNSFRAAHGLAPFEANGALMASAQGHSSYMAASGSITHTGAGGSDCKSRALAAGYGGGANVSVVENIYGGSNASSQSAVNFWKGDSLHLNTLLSTRHTEAGVGVAADGNGAVYYTLDIGVVLDGAAPPPAAPGAATSGSSAPAASTPAATAAPYHPIVLATPLPDGSIVHVVKEGQTLWTIAALYKVNINDLLRINNLYTGSFIKPGQKITIRQAGAPLPAATVSVEVTSQATQPLSATSPPKRTAVPTLAAAQLAKSGLEPGHTSVVSTPSERNNLLVWVIGALVVLGGVLLAAGSLLGRRPTDE